MMTSCRFFPPFFSIFGPVSPSFFWWWPNVRVLVYLFYMTLLYAESIGSVLAVCCLQVCGQPILVCVVNNMCCMYEWLRFECFIYYTKSLMCILGSTYYVYFGVDLCVFWGQLIMCILGSTYNVYFGVDLYSLTQNFEVDFLTSIARSTCTSQFTASKILIKSVLNMMKRDLSPLKRKGL